MLTSIIPPQVSASNMLAGIDRSLGGQNSISSGIAKIADPSAYKAYKGMSATKMDSVAQDFESMFVSQMVETMFGESMGDEAFGSSDTDDIYKGMIGQEYGKIISNSGGIGIASYVKRELLKLQEV
jgi:peptidoglycan hydrolase FlgJ